MFVFEGMGKATGTASQIVHKITRPASFTALATQSTRSRGPRPSQHCWLPARWSRPASAPSRKCPPWTGSRTELPGP